MGQKKSKKAKKAVSKKEKEDDIWVVGDQQERERIREFWAGLDQQKRRALVMLEKEAVLKKMKEQQKQTCSCSVCGRRRNDIESQMEFLYNSYYQELESFASTKQQNISTPQVLKASEMPSLVDDNSMDEFDDELSDPDDFSPLTTKSDDSGISEFGSSLTVQGGILTVADDFLKNDGRKFLDLMEQLSHRAPDDDSGDSDNDIDWDDRDDDSNSEDYDEEEQVRLDLTQIHNSEHQRMEETRKMFQIFAAKMFEQRVLTAYREKAASDRAAKLMQELEEEENEKKAKDQAKQKKIELEKQKKKALKLKQEQEKAALEQERIKKEELIAQKKEEERIKQQKLLEEQEKARIAEKERQDAKLLEKRRKKELKREEKARKEEERLRLLAEETAKQEAKAAEELEMRLALEKAEREKAEALAREAQREAELKIMKEKAALKAKEDEKREKDLAREVERREMAALAERRERDALKEGEKLHSRTLADEHSKKLKVRLETRATREQAQNARIKLKEKKATKVSEAMRSNVIPSSIPTSLGLTETSMHETSHFQPQNQSFARGFQSAPPQSLAPSVMQFFHNTKKNDQHIPVQSSSPNPVYHSAATSKLGVSLQSSLPTLGNLWKDNQLSNQNADAVIHQPSHSAWTTTGFARPSHLNVSRDSTRLYDDEDAVFNKIQDEIRRTETEEVIPPPGWTGGHPKRVSRAGPPGFSNFGYPVEDHSVGNDLWKSGGGRYNFK